MVKECSFIRINTLHFLTKEYDMKKQPPPLENIADENYEINLPSQSFFSSKAPQKMQLKTCRILDGQVHITTYAGKEFEFPLENSDISFCDTNEDTRIYEFKTSSGKFKIKKIVSQMPELGWREFENRLSIKESKLNVFLSLLSNLS